MKMDCEGKRFTVGSLLLILSLVVCGCNEEDGPKLSFSHNLHVTDNGLACADCHGKATEGHFARPGHDACTDCHEEWLKSDVVDENTCGKCHAVKYLPKESKTSSPTAPVKAVGVFEHSDVLSNRCNDCHGALLAEGVKQVQPMTRRDRIAIRNRAHTSGMDCTACHRDMDAGTPPADHRENWWKRHGVLGSQDDRACGVCHQDESCRECHQTTAPDSHNNLWRLKTHGLQAAADRSRCQVCHEQDSCTACHSQARPQSHNAAWSKTHCNQCHPNSQAGAGCSLCHEDGLDGHPNPHAANWKNKHCDSCHEDASQCKACHGWSGMDQHPDPHSAGWGKKHCNSCHPDGSSNCKTCHGWSGIDQHPDPHAANWGVKHCNSCHDDKSCKICHPGGLDAHPNPHRAGWKDQHCNACHADASKCEICHEGGISSHPNPHAAGWSDSHCTSCHPGDASSEECGICHEGGRSVLVHQSFWPPVHDRFGDAADCADCHPL